MTLCVNGSLFTNETVPPGSIVKIVGVGQASRSSTVSPLPWVAPEWHPPPAIAGGAGNRRAAKATAASTDAIRPTIGWPPFAWVTEPLHRGWGQIGRASCRERV